MPVDAGTVTARIRVDTATLRADLNTANTAFSTFGKQMNVSALGIASTWVKAFTGIGSAIAGVIAVAQGFKTAITTFGQFEQSMANVASVSKASAEDFARLQQAAEEAGASTRFTASQAADALYYLASAGFSATQSVGALNGVLYLAGATQSDLAFTSETVASAISQFGLEAEDATRVANVFTAAITNSQATMDKLAVSMRYVGPIAAAFGYTIEDVSGLLQILYNNGYEASQAGTALRSSLADLSNASSPAIAKLEALGVSFEQVNPATHSFSEILRVLADAGLEAADIMAIFGDRAGPAMVTLLKEGADAVDEYTEAVTGTNAAAEAYNRQNDTLLGDFDKMKSAAENLAIVLGRQLAPFLRDLITIGTQLLIFLAEVTPGLVDFARVLTAPISIIAALGAEMARGAEFGADYEASLRSTTDSLSLVDRTISDLKGLSEQRNELDSLVKEYETLVGKSDKTIEEQGRLAAVIQLISEKVPEAADAFDEYGKAIGLNVDVAKKASQDLLTIEKANKEAALQILVAEKEIADQRVQSLEFLQQDTKKEYLEQKRRLDQRKAEVSQIALIEREKVLAVQAAGDDLNAVREAQLVAARKLVALGVWTKEDLTRLEDGVVGFGQLWVTTVEPIKEEYASLTKEVDKQFQEWKTVEEQLARSRDLTLDIAKAEKELLGIDSALTTLSEVRTETKKKEKALTDEEKKLLEDRAKLEEEYLRKVKTQSDNKLEILEYEYTQEIALADQLGADKTNIEKYYQGERDKIRQEALEKEKADFSDQLDYVAGWYSKASGYAVDFFSALAELRKVDIENEIADLDAKTEAQLAQLETNYQNQLAAAGLAQQTAIETAQVELEAAIASDNAERINAAQLALQKAQIDADYEAKKAALEKEAAKEKAKLEYKANLATWEARVLSAGAQIPLMIMNAVSAGWQAPFPAAPFVAAAFGAAAAVTGGIQLAAVIASKPEAPRFNTGGIVQGPPGVDVIDAKLTSGEIVMNEAQQNRLMRILNGEEALQGGTNGGNFTIILEDFGYQAAKLSAPWFENGTVRVRFS